LSAESLIGKHVRVRLSIISGGVSVSGVFPFRRLALTRCRQVDFTTNTGPGSSAYRFLVSSSGAVMALRGDEWLGSVRPGRFWEPGLASFLDGNEGAQFDSSSRRSYGHEGLTGWARVPCGHKVALPRCVGSRVGLERVKIGPFCLTTYCSSSSYQARFRQWGAEGRSGGSRPSPTISEGKRAVLQVI
jgi:hypothetical protein